MASFSSLLVAILVAVRLATVSACAGSFVNLTRRADLIGSEQGAMDFIAKHKDRGPWPVKGRYQPLTYCYASAQTRTSLESAISKAIQNWITALGGSASKAAGHNLLIQEVAFINDKPQFCYLSDYKDEFNVGTWNSAIPDDTLVIHNALRGAISSVGYDATHKAPGRHILSVNPDELGTALVAVTTHEFGHVIGLGHEHQRSDRDQYLIFRCYNIAGLEEVIERASKKLPGASREALIFALCHNQAFASKVGFSSIDFTKIPRMEETLRGPYDVKSIMQYTSAAGAADTRKCAENVKFCPITLRGRDGHPEEFIPLNVVPTALDADAVRKLYPWKG